MSQKQMVYDALNEMNIPYRSVEHTAVFTVEEMRKLKFPPGAEIAKNLFLRDAKGRRHFLITAGAEQAVDLKALERILDSTRLSFASEERLQKYLGLTKGSVTPFGLLNDTGQSVEFYLDEALCNTRVVGVHPNDNTATVLISAGDLQKFIRATGHEIHFVGLSG